MAQSATLYRFRIDLTDVDRGVYEKLDVRTPMHPSESEPHLVTRLLAFALNYAENLQFSKGGLSSPEDPCISAADRDGVLELWIEIGNPSAKRLHQAAKKSPKVKIYTYKNPELLVRELQSERIYQPERLELLTFTDGFLAELCASLTRDISWNLIRNDGTLMVQVGDHAIEGDVIRHSLESLYK